MSHLKFKLLENVHVLLINLSINLVYPYIPMCEEEFRIISYIKIQSHAFESLNCHDSIYTAGLSCDTILAHEVLRWPHLEGTKWSRQCFENLVQLNPTRPDFHLSGGYPYTKSEPAKIKVEAIAKISGVSHPWLLPMPSVSSNKCSPYFL